MAVPRRLAEVKASSVPTGSHSVPGPNLDKDSDVASSARVVSALTGAPQTSLRNVSFFLTSGLYGNQAIKTCYAASNSLEEWKHVPISIEPGSWLASYTGRLIVGSVSGIVSSYLIQNNTVNDEKYPRMRVGRRWARAVRIANCIYVIGGIEADGERPVARLEWLDLVTGVWTQSSSPQAFPCAWPVLALDTETGSIFCVSEAGVVERYDVARDRWEECSRLRAELGRNAGGCSAVYYKGLLYILGGHFKVSAVLDVANGQWSSISQPHHPHAFAAALVSQGDILLFGGEGTTVIEKYHLHSGHWSTCLLPMPCEMDHHNVLLRID